MGKNLVIDLEIQYNFCKISAYDKRYCFSIGKSDFTHTHPLGRQVKKITSGSQGLSNWPNFQLTTHQSVKAAKNQVKYSNNDQKFIHFFLLFGLPNMEETSYYKCYLYCEHRQRTSELNYVVVQSSVSGCYST